MRFDAAGAVTAVALLSAGEARELQPGMEVRIRIEGANGAGHETLRGEVAVVSDSSRVPPWIGTTPLAAAAARDDDRNRLVTFALTLPEERPGWEDLRPCRVEIVRERVSPVALLVSSASR